MTKHKKEKILVTGTAGFIGFHLAQRLLKEGYEVVGLDNINDYYDVGLKYARLNETGINKDSKPGSSLMEATSYKPQATSLNDKSSIENNLEACSLKPEANSNFYIHPAVQKVRKEESIFEYSRLYTSTKHPDYRFVRLTLEDKDLILELFKREKFDRVVHLAAQAGVRYSLENPWTYLDCNIYGFLSILEACRPAAAGSLLCSDLQPACLPDRQVAHLVYASSSSVYGLNTKMPLSSSDNVDHPISLYAATKKSNELMAHTYSHLYQIPTTGLRFFTVYGPWGRPDMALFIFTKKILADEPIDVYNYGNMERDFTYIDDIIEGVYRVMQKPPEKAASYKLQATGKKIKLETKNPQPETDQSANQPIVNRQSNQAIRQSGNQAIDDFLDPSHSPTAPYRLYNIGNSSPVRLMDFIAAIEKVTGKKADKYMKPIQAGDIPATFSDVRGLVKELEYQPKTPVLEGIKQFVDWYKKSYKPQATSYK